MMKKIGLKCPLFCVYLFVGLAGAHANAGVGSSGGGKGILCNGILRTLDLYEAEEIYHLSIPNNFPDLNSSLAVHAVQAAQYMSSYQLDTSNPEVTDPIVEWPKENIIALFKDIPSGTSLPSTLDATIPSLPSECSVVQIAVYSDTEHLIRRDLALWNKLSVADQTALVLHEMEYSYARGYNVKSSDDVRRIVGLLMSNTPPEPREQPLYGKTKLTCFTGTNTGDPGSLLNITDETRNGVSGVGVYYNVLNQMLHWGRTSVFIPGLSAAAIQNGTFQEVRGLITEPLFNRSWIFQLIPNPLTGGFEAQTISTEPNSQMISENSGFCGFN